MTSSFRSAARAPQLYCSKFFSFPVRTIFEPYPEGVVAIAITPNAKYLATVSAGDPQVLAIWDWTTGDDLPIHTAQLDSSYGQQVSLSICRILPSLRTTAIAAKVKILRCKGFFGYHFLYSQSDLIRILEKMKKCSSNAIG